MLDCAEDAMRVFGGANLTDWLRGACRRGWRSRSFALLRMPAFEMVRAMGSRFARFWPTLATKARTWRGWGIRLCGLAAAILCASGQARTTAPVAWAGQIAPLLYKTCVTCHHAGGAGPFSLVGYAAARRWGPQILRVTQSRFMPPWLPEPGHGDFADDRRLSDADLALVKKWVTAGMPAGKSADAPAAPTFDQTWQLGKPDLVLSSAAPFMLPAGGTDVFRNFIFPNPLKGTHYVRAMEIRPGAPQVVHHANVLVDRTGSLRRMHPDDWRGGVQGMEILLDAGNTFDPDSHFLFWKPDTPALVEAEGMPWRLDEGNDLILNIHLKPSGKAETIDAQIGLYFTDKPPEKQPMLLQLDCDDALNIPPGDASFVVENELTLPVAVDVLGIYPHAHYLGKEMEGWATLPGGEKKWLVWIKDWDIDRQSVYRYREPVHLPKGTVVHMRYVYDNSSGNPRNPHNPPVRVGQGNRSEDEMAHMWLQVLPAPPKPDEPDPRLALEEAWMRNRLRKTPDDRVSLYNLAAALTGEERYAEAVEVYEREQAGNGADARTLTAMGVAQAGAGDWRGARKSLARAAADDSAPAEQRCDARFDLASLDLRHQDLHAAEEGLRAVAAECPDDAGALAALGGLDLDAGANEEAIQLLSKAVALNPADAELRAQLARGWAQAGDLAKAAAELRQAERLKPEDAEMHSALSQVLAATGELEAAIVEAKKALKLREEDADGWSNLGVLEARTGHPDDARRDFEHALRIQPDHAQARANLARLTR